MDEETKMEAIADTFVPQTKIETTIDRTESQKTEIVENIEVLGRHVPARIIQYHLNRVGNYEIKPFAQTYEAAVLFADISGFSSLAENLAKELNCQANAAESLSQHIGKSLEKMVKAVCTMGGDVIKFAGDAILVVFPVDNFLGSLKAATQCCITVALDMLELDLQAGGVPLSVHCGVGAGKVLGYHVGGLHNRWEYVITGDPVNQVGSAEPEAQAGEVVISKYAHGLVSGIVEGESLESGNFKVIRIHNNKKFQEKELIFSKLRGIFNNPEEVKRINTVLRYYVPRPVLNSIDSGHGNWIAELRICSTLFCRLIGLKFKSPDDIHMIQHAVSTVQKKIYKFEGTLCRFIVDDKGAGLLFAFGLPPLMHENDAERATKAAFEIHGEIKKISTPEANLTCSIGVTSGRVFCGTAGGSIRCEYTLHGTLVNLAARYMVAAKDGILCGEATYLEARKTVLFHPAVKIKVKGKDEAVNVYRPYGYCLVTELDSSNLIPQIGREKEERAIDDGFHSLQTEKEFKNILVFEGDAGMGKTRMVKYAHEKASSYEGQITLVVGNALDSEKNKPFYIWNSIFYQLILKYYEKLLATCLLSVEKNTTLDHELYGTVRRKENVDETMRVNQKFLIEIRRLKFPTFDELANEWKMAVIKDILHDLEERDLLPLLSMILLEIEQVPDNETTSSMKGESRYRGLFSIVKPMIFKIIQILKKKVPLESIPHDDSNNMHFDGQNRNSSENHIAKEYNVERKQSDVDILDDSRRLELQSAATASYVAICLENIQWIDSLSLELLSQLCSSSITLSILITCRDVGSQWRSNIAAEFKRLASSAICKSFKLKCFSYTELKEAMYEWLGVNQLPEEAISAVFDRCGGQPLFAEELCKLMKNDGILVKKGNKMILRGDKSGDLGLPDNVSALMTAKLDRLTPAQQHILKRVSVVGMSFFKYEVYELTTNGKSGIGARAKVDKEIQELVDSGFLEQTQGPGSMMSFKSAMLRESAYNLLLFKDRKELHLKIAKYLEERNKQYLDIVWATLANHYYLAEEYKNPASQKSKTITYLELAGEDASSVHAMSQVWLCYDRLLSLNKKYTKSIPIETVATWNQRAGHALQELGKVEEAVKHFYEALTILGLDLRTISSQRSRICFSNRTPKLRLVTVLPKFQELIQRKRISMLLTGAKVYSQLARVRPNRELPFTRECIMNAILLVEAASELADTERKTMSKVEHDEVSGELAKMYASAAIFYAPLLKAASGIQDYVQGALLAVKKVENSGIQASVYLKCSEYAIMTGDFQTGRTHLRKATWICKFINYETMLLSCCKLAIVNEMFTGNVYEAGEVATVSYNSYHNMKLLPLWSRSAILRRDYNLCEQILEMACRVPIGSFRTNTQKMFGFLEGENDPDISIAFSLLLGRKYKNSNLALRAAVRAAELLVQMEAPDYPIVIFHTYIFAIQAIYESLFCKDLHFSTRRSSFSRFRNILSAKVAPREHEHTQTLVPTAEAVARQLMKHIQGYNVYSICAPCVAYSSGMTELIAKKTKVAKSRFEQCIDLAVANKQPFVTALSYYQLHNLEKDFTLKSTYAKKSLDNFAKCNINYKGTKTTEIYEEASLMMKANVSLAALFISDDKTGVDSMSNGF